MIQGYGEHLSDIAVGDDATFMREEGSSIVERERNRVPTKVNGFRFHKHFVLEDALYRYDMVHPDAKPYKNLKV